MSQALSLDDLIARARDYRMSPSEKRAQRVSLIMGLSSRKSTLSREKVEEILDQVEGSGGVETCNR